jgi:hypothetical protein
MTAPTEKALPEWPVFDRDGYLDPPDSALLAHEREVSAAWEARARLAVEALRTLAAQTSGKPGSTARADCMAALANATVRSIGPLPELPPEAK